LGAHLVFVDESGFLLIPTVRKTWAPRGRTPVVRHRYRHDKISVISGLAVSPTGRRLSLYFRCHTKNLTAEDVAEFLRHLLRHLRGPVIVIWDNAQIHKGPAVRALCTNPCLHLEPLPPYAPELNPDEGVWGYAKRALSNGRPDSAWELLEELLTVLHGLARSPRHLRGFIQQSNLPPFLPKS